MFCTEDGTFGLKSCSSAPRVRGAARANGNVPGKDLSHPPGLVVAADVYLKNTPNAGKTAYSIHFRFQSLIVRVYRGTSLIRNHRFLALYSSPLPVALRWS